VGDDVFDFSDPDQPEALNEPAERREVPEEVYASKD
jgi:hypothetical protein